MPSLQVGLRMPPEGFEKPNARLFLFVCHSFEWRSRRSL